jgi:hypothetical protein
MVTNQKCLSAMIISNLIFYFERDRPKIENSSNLTLISTFTISIDNKLGNILVCD